VSESETIALSSRKKVAKPPATWVDRFGISTPRRKRIVAVAIAARDLAVPIVDHEFGMLPLRKFPSPLDGLNFGWQDC
jgi:hypothetical protein